MPDLKKAACIILLVTMPLSAIARQNPAEKKAASDKAANPATEKKPALDPALQKILAVLDQLLEAQKGFADNNLRIVIQGEVADMLWSYDQPRARRLFEDAFQTPPTSGVSEQSASASTSSGQTESRYSARLGIIQFVTRRDPALAAKLIDGVVDQSPNSPPKTMGNGYVLFSEWAMLQERLAFNFAQADPPRAAQIAQSLIGKVSTGRLMVILNLIRGRNAKAADEVVMQALAQAKTGQPSFDDIKGFASYLFPAFGEGVISFSPTASNNISYQPRAISPEAVEQFFDLTYNTITRRLDAALKNGESMPLNARTLLDYTLPKLLAPYIDRFLPERAAAFRARVDEVSNRVPSDEQPYLAMTEPGAVQELVARANALADARVKDMLYQRAVLQAILDGNFDQASAIADKINNEDSRLNIIENLRLRMDQRRTGDAWRALEQGDIDKAESLAAEISDLNQSLRLLNTLVGRLVTKDQPRAARILNDAQQRVVGTDNSIERARQLMALTAVAANVDVNRGFADMELAIKEFNRAGFAPEYEKYQELETTGASGKKPARVNIGLVTLLSTRDFQWLGGKDFDHALMLAQQFQMREAAAIAQLNACRGALEKHQSSNPQRLPATAKPPATDKASQP